MKHQIQPNKNIQRILSHENNSQLDIVILNQNPFILTLFAEDHEVDEINKTTHKTDKVDQTVKIIKTKTLVF